MNPKLAESSLNLAGFAQASSAQDVSAALTALIKTKEIHAARDSDSFLIGLGTLERLAADKADAESCLLAIAALQRARAVLKRQASRITGILTKVLDEVLPSLQALSSAEDRYYVASALELASGTWVADYAARELTLESLSDNTAEALAGTLLRLNGSVEDALGLMTRHIGEISRGGTKPADAAARRLRRILNAIRGALVARHLDPGGNVAKPLRAYIVAMLEPYGAPQDQKSVRELVDATAGTIDDLIRTRLSLVVVSELYLVMSFPRRWAGSFWSGAVSKSTAVKKLGGNLLEGIRISARQGITDQGLIEAAEVLFGGRDKALAETGKIADDGAGFPESVQSWLRRGRLAPSDAGSSLVAQHELLQTDQYVAAALLAAVDANKNAQVLPSKFNDILKAVMDLARARHLQSFGEVGAVIDYSRGSHTVVSGIVDATKVRIIRPGVERLGSDSVRTVVIKAIVETVREDR